jgi:hypothetical protein
MDRDIQEYRICFQSPVAMGNMQPQVRVTVSTHHQILMFTVCALQAIAPMQVYSKVYGDYGANKRPRGPDGKRDWTYGLLDCFDRFGLCT